MPPPHHILFYDGRCGLCNRLNRFVLTRDRDQRFRFASLQSDYANRVLPEYGKNPGELDTFYILADAETQTPRLYERASAALFLLHELGWPWRAANVLKILPLPLLDWGYNRLARNRYRFFGQTDTCLMPEEHVRERFIDW